MHLATRRGFLEDIARGMLFISLGPSLLEHLGLEAGLELQEEDRLTFGSFEPLACLMQDTPASKLQPELVKMLKEGATLKTLVAGAALANARTFGGHDYTGYHCAMALVPAWQMAEQMTDARLAPLPVLKVLHRNTARIREFRKGSGEMLRPLSKPSSIGDAEALIAAERRHDMAGAEAIYARIARGGPQEAFEAIQPLVRENIDVHQVVLAWRSWDLLKITGREHANTMLRQAMRQCVVREGSRARKGRPVPGIRDLLPRLIEKHRLRATASPLRKVDDRFIDKLAMTIFSGSRQEAASAAARALGSGVGAADVGEAISLAAVRLLLHDPGRSHAEAGKPRGSVHGASVGVHASDAASAWRNIARQTGYETGMAGLITAAWHTGGQAGRMNRQKPMHDAAREAAGKMPAGRLLGAIDECIRGQEQASATAMVERYGALGQPAAPLVDLLLTHSVTSDGALHHEKYFRTAFEEFQASRPRFRWLHLAALARVTASGHGFVAPGLAEARKLLRA